QLSGRAAEVPGQTEIGPRCAVFCVPGGRFASADDVGCRLMSCSERSHVLCLQTLGAAGCVELHLLVLLGGAEAGGVDCAEVYEDVVGSVRGRDESEALFCVEPFYGASGH